MHIPWLVKIWQLILPTLYSSLQDYHFITPSPNRTDLIRVLNQRPYRNLFEFAYFLRSCKMLPIYFKRNIQYFPIHQEEKIEVSEATHSRNVASSATIEVDEKSLLCNLKYLLWISWSVILCLILSNLYTWKRLYYKTDISVFCMRLFWTIMAISISSTNSSALAPASSVVQYKYIVPTSGIRDEISPYQGPPSETNNQLWEDLYSCEYRRGPLETSRILLTCLLSRY